MSTRRTREHHTKSDDHCDQEHPTATHHDHPVSDSLLRHTAGSLPWFAQVRTSRQRTRSLKATSVERIASGSALCFGRRAEPILFSKLEPYAGTCLQAVGSTHTDAGESSDSAPGAGRVAVATGRQCGTVDPRFVKEAAREAIRAQDVDLLCVLGFAFGPQATGVTESDGVTVESADEGLPTSRASGGSAALRCSWSA